MAQQGTQIDLATIPLQQLSNIRQGLEEEVSFLMSSQQQLKVAHGRFVNSADTIQTLKQSPEGQEILVPLSSSLYIPGKLTNFETVTVDIGTGYHVEKSLPEAEKYFGRRQDFIQKNIDEINKTLQQKEQMLALATEVFQTRVREEVEATSK